MRIMVFSTDDFMFPAGGAETAFGEISQRLGDIHFDLICAKLRYKSGSLEEHNNVTIYRLGLGIPMIDKIWLALFGHRTALRLAKKNKYDLIWTILASYGGFAAIETKEKLKIPMLLTLQEGNPVDEITDKANLARFVGRKYQDIFTKADGLQAISKYLENWGKTMGFKSSVSCVVPNGVDTSIFTPVTSMQETATIRSKLGLGASNRLLISTSRLVSKNGLADVITAMARLPNDIHFLICGSGPLEASLKSLCQSLGLGERIHFLGFVRRSELPDLLRASDIFIRTSHSEGLGSSFFEAMAVKIPVIGTDVGGIKDFLTNNVTGYVAKVGDPENIAETISRAFQDPNKQIIIENAYKMVIETYNWNKISDQMRKLFSQIVS